jgi:mannose-6-phosphate isomerase
MMLEVQQNSNSTFRVYDWGRKGADGMSRPLHIEDALQCLKFDDVGDPRAKSLILEDGNTLTRWQVLSSLFFSVEKLEIKAPYVQECDPSTFQIFFHIERGESTLLPADSESLDLEIGTYIRIYLPPMLGQEHSTH